MRCEIEQGICASTAASTLQLHAVAAPSREVHETCNQMGDITVEMPCHDEREFLERSTH